MDNFIQTKLVKKLWRLNHLYYIRDKHTNIIQFKLNNAQKKILSYTHNKKIILKSRQMGISTLYLLNNLDDCLVVPGFQAGIQSYGEDESKKLSKRALFAWDRLDQEIKDLIGYLTIGEPLKLITSNTKEFGWNNGSTLKIGNFRGDTLQSLHVSELGKIAKKYPDKARELKTGAFQAVATDNKITIESTAEGKSGLFYTMWTKAYDDYISGKQLTPLDFMPIFLSWTEDPDCRLNMEVDIPENLDKYFSELEEELKIKLDNEQKWWYVKKKEELGDDMFQEYPATPEEAFTVVKDGAYYSKFYNKFILKRRRLINNLYDKNLPVNVVMDLGINDTMVVLFYQYLYSSQGLEIRIIDVYTNSGEGLEHYVDIIKNKPYRYKDVHVPHDANVKELGTGKTRISILKELGINSKLLPKLRVNDGIELVRKYIPYMYIDNSLSIIKDTFLKYRKSWNDRLGVWNSEPVHDEWSHTADAIRYMCMSIPSQNNTRKYKKINTNSIDL